MYDAHCSALEVMFTPRPPSNPAGRRSTSNCSSRSGRVASAAAANPAPSAADEVKGAYKSLFFENRKLKAKVAACLSVCLNPTLPACRSPSASLPTSQAAHALVCLCFAALSIGLSSSLPLTICHYTHDATAPPPCSPHQQSPLRCSG